MPSSSGKLPRIAIVGASSLLGKDLKQTLENRNFPASDIVLLDDTLMAGTLTEAGGEPTFIRALDEDSFEGADFVFFCGTGADAERNWSAAQRTGATVIDLTGAARASGKAIMSIPALAAAMPPPVAAASEPRTRPAYYSPPSPVIIACTLTTALNGFHPQRIALVLFPPVSERDQAGIEELENQTASLLSFRPIEQTVFGTQVAFNLLSAYGEGSKPALDDTKSAIARDVASYLAGRAPVPAIQLLQAPVFYGYACTAYAEFASAQNVEALEAAFANVGVKTVTTGDAAPTNVSAADDSQIQLGRITADTTVATGVWLWGVADNLRLATTNAVRIAEELFAKRSE
jgi:aspartate-semialdehyde dehydrogenase